jgi:hypothetical protein
MFTPYIDLGLYPPELSFGGGILWPDGYTASGSCLPGHTYTNIGSYGSEQGGTPNKFGYMTDMNSGNNIPGSRFLTLAFLVSALGYTDNKEDLDIRPCFGGVNAKTQRWMYDTMADYYWSETNSLDIWINSIRQHSTPSDIILSYGGYNNRMSADTLWDKLGYTDTDICNDIANYKGLQDLSISATTLQKYGIKDINPVHDIHHNYQWGYNGTPKGDETQYATNLYACYYLPMMYYKVRWLDFDVEAAAQGLLNWPAQIMRILGLRKLMMETPNVNVRYTFPTFPGGLDRGYPILYLTMYAFQNCDVSVRRRLYVNLMTMDYGGIGDFGFGATDGDNNTVMGKASLMAVCNTAYQMQQLSDNIYKNKFKNDPLKKNLEYGDYWLSDKSGTNTLTNWQDGYFAHIGNTPMLGLNDITVEVFPIESANILQNFVEKSKSIFVSEQTSTLWATTLSNPAYTIWSNDTYMQNHKPPTYKWLKKVSSGQTLYDYMIHNTSAFGPSGHIAMWSLERDTPCLRNEGGGYVSTSCSSMHNNPQDVLEFSKIFQETQNAQDDLVTHCGPNIDNCQTCIYGNACFSGFDEQTCASKNGKWCSNT